MVWGSVWLLWWGLALCRQTLARVIEAWQVAFLVFLAGIVSLIKFQKRLSGWNCDLWS